MILPRHPPAANTVTGDTFGFPRNTPTSSGGEGSWVHCGAVPAALCHRSRGVPGASGGHAAGGTERDRSCFQKKVKPAALAAGASISCCESRCRDSGAHAATSNGWSVCLENKARISIGRFRWLRAPATICGRPLYCKGRSFFGTHCRIGAVMCPACLRGTAAAGHDEIRWTQSPIKKALMCEHGCGRGVWIQGYDPSACSSVETTLQSALVLGL